MIHKSFENKFSVLNDWQSKPILNCVNSSNLKDLENLCTKRT